VIESPWGPLPIADAHVHFFSRRFFEALAEQKPGLTLESMTQTLGWQMPPENPEGLALAWVAELDRYGMGRAVLIASVPGDEASVSAAVSAHPNRFYGYFMVNPIVPDAVKRVQGALDAGVLRGICLFPAMHRFSMQDDAARSILDVVAATRPATVVFVHCGVLTVGVRKRLGIPSLFDMRFSNPIDLYAVALRYPQIRFVLPHFGAGYFREALMLADLCPNVYLDTSSSNRWMSYHASDLDLRTVFRRALAVVGPKRLLFGSDSSFFPRGWVTDVFRDQSKALYELGLSEDEARLIFGENLVHLLG
jgi:predicted TIM-barrel fold metal-dependent hydrolase